MKITFVVPKDDDRSSPLSQFVQCRILPPVGLRRMAGLAGKRGAVALVDERIGSARHNYQADIALFFINSYNRARCLVLAKLYRDAGCHVVFSGSMLANDALEPAQYADSLLVGYGEDCIAEFLFDYQRGKAKAFYHSANKAKVNSEVGGKRGYPTMQLAC
ncbi:MAG: hypothetical protein AMJ53_05830 [Gammaproteobacteria bacterium SG8_11]|nr:MAG: hypothetical protein AMJ53_05830 [Gammaproteobacteria bacterium SG8_11]